MSDEMPLILVLFTLTAFVDAIDYAALCPKGFKCYEKSTERQLTVNYGNERQTNVNMEQMSRELDSLLSAEHLKGSLTSLRVTNSPLTRVPASVCQLVNLTTLYLDRNNFTELPDNCFTRLTKLVTLSLRNNAIAGLQDGLFGGLQSLESLDLRYNQIAFIGLRLFSNASDLTSLRLLNLRYNNLKSVEPWWYYRCIVGSERSDVKIVLSNNMISNFTNKLQWNFNCGMKRPFGSIDLSGNQITHIMDILNGWNLASLTKLFCLANTRGEYSRMKFHVGGHTYACDCIDYEIYKLVKMAPKITSLNDVYCKVTKFSSDIGQYVRVISLPLNQFVCDATDGCPSSCRCAYRPDNSTLHVYCSSTNMTSLPLDLPPLPKSYVRYKLDFSNNKLLRRLEHRPYFANTSILDVTNCGLTELTVQLVEDVSHLKLANFRRNMLQSFPRQVDTVNISAMLFLGHNPWKCSCDNSWMIEWLNSLSGQILDPGDVICKTPSSISGRNVLKSTKDDFCADPAQRSLRISLSVVAAVLALVIILVVAGLLFYKLREQVYRRWKFHPFDRDECQGEDMDYDVFLCCSSLDDEQHGQQIHQRLEANGYHVCYHERDFLPGERITDNMSQSVERSRRTVCLITDNFLQSPFCMTEFDMAYHHNVAEKRKKRLIVLMMLDNPNQLYADDASDKATLRQFLRQYTYIDYTKDNWFDRLLYALPINGLLQQHDQARNDDVPLLRDVQPADN